jgi:uncharacterized protein YjiS (DUF1127 family)
LVCFGIHLNDIDREIANQHLFEIISKAALFGSPAMDALKLFDLAPADMSTSASAASSRAHGPSYWGQLNHVLGEWWQHLRSRSELESLDDSMLRDIGLSRREVGFDVSKHIWTN